MYNRVAAWRSAQFIVSNIRHAAAVSSLAELVSWWPLLGRACAPVGNWHGGLVWAGLGGG